MAQYQYNAANSLSPMMFKKALTRNERMRSKSMDFAEKENHSLLDMADKTAEESRKRGFSAAQRDTGWTEVRMVKSTHPVVCCLLPSLSMDFVASCLLAIGATPLITEDPEDVKNDISNSKAVVVDASAPRELVETYIAEVLNCPYFQSIPVVLVATGCGSSDRKKDLAFRVLELRSVKMVTGRNGDIVVLAQAFLESDQSDEEQEKTLPRVLYNNREVVDENNSGSSISLPPVLRRAKKKQQRSRTSSPTPETANGCGGNGEGGAGSRDHSPSRFRSPPHRSPSPRTSPIASPRGVRKFLKKKSHAIERVPTMLPSVAMKGQFRETQMSHVRVMEALQFAHKLCAETTAFVHLYETNTVTSGEVVMEIKNCQVGMGNLHSTLACSAAVAAAVMACINPEQSDKVQVEHCGHALSLYYVAAQEAAAEVTKEELVSPGTLRQTLIDLLHRLTAEDVKTKAEISYHRGELKS